MNKNAKGYCTREYTHPLYDAWRNIKRRCYYSNSKYFKNYGGRGIIVCDEWLHDFNVFLSWALSSGWEYGLTIDRTDNDGNYEPNNCRWITRREQLLNRRNNHLVTYRGITKTITEWAEHLGIHKSTFAKRLKNWSIDRAFNEPVAR